jgi:hypothetical protein
LSIISFLPAVHKVAMSFVVALSLPEHSMLPKVKRLLRAASRESKNHPSPPQGFPPVTHYIPFREATGTCSSDRQGRNMRDA